jgi:hypothetical protein
MGMYVCAKSKQLKNFILIGLNNLLQSKKRHLNEQDRKKIPPPTKKPIGSSLRITIPDAVYRLFNPQTWILWILSIIF